MVARGETSGACVWNVGALKVRRESLRTFSAHSQQIALIQTFHVRLPSSRRCRGEEIRSILNCVACHAGGRDARGPSS